MRLLANAISKHPKRHLNKLCIYIITYNFTTNPDPDEPETERRDFLLPFTLGNESIMQGNGYIVLSVTNKDFTVYYGNIEYRLTDLIRYAYEQ